MAEVLEISDGTTTISLITATGTVGWHLRGFRAGWLPQVPRYKGGGTWQDSSLATGRYLADKKFANVIDTLFLHLEASDQDNAISTIRALQQLLEKAAEYWVTDWQEEPVWIRAQAEDETNSRYAIIYTGLIPEFNDPYGCRFEGGVSTANDTWMWNLSLILEHGLWMANAPGTGTVTELSALEAYDGRNLGNVDSGGIRDPTSDNEVYIANKFNEANVTDIYTWSAANGFSANLMAAVLPYDLVDIVGAAPAVNDYVAFGIDTGLADSGPFCSLVFDIGTAISGITLTWEYWNGAWVALTTQDNTKNAGAGGGVPFDTTGVHSVHWEHEADWTTTAVNGVTGYWVRARVTAAPGPHTAPTQQNRDVYSITWGYTEIQANVIGGDISALVRIYLQNWSYGSGGPTGNMRCSHYVVGGRSVSRGSNFRAYLNFADEQNPTGVAVTAGVNSAFQNRIQSQTGRVIRWTRQAGSERIADIDLTSSMAAEYTGRYRVFLRLYQSAGADYDLPIELRVREYGTLTPATTLASATFRAQQDFAIADFGTHDFGFSGYAPTSVLTPFTLDFEIWSQANTSGTTYLILYDLIFIPVDEWAGEFQVVVDTTDSSQHVSYDSRLVVDSVEYPKRSIRSYVENISGSYIQSTYLATSPDSAQVQSDEQQRIWAFAGFNDNTVLDVYAYMPYSCHSIQVARMERFLVMRGAT